MIAIPNMEKPKGCVNCPVNALACELWTEVANIKAHKHKDCPLIEIVRCKDCKHRDPEDKKCDSGMLERQGCIFPVDDDYFCKYGERRNDD